MTLINPFIFGVTPDDDFDGTSLDGKWSWYQQGNATATVGSGAATLVAPTNSSTPAYLTQDITYLSGNWTMTAKLGGTYGQTGGAYLGVVAYNATSGKAMLLQVPVKSSISSGNSYVQKRTGTAFTSNATNFLFTFADPIYLRIAISGSNIVFSTSTNNSTYTQRHSEALSTFIGSVERVGFVLVGGTSSTTGGATCTADSITKT